MLCRNGSDWSKQQKKKMAVIGRGSINGSRYTTSCSRTRLVSACPSSPSAIAPNDVICHYFPLQCLTQSPLLLPPVTSPKLFSHTVTPHDISHFIFPFLSSNVSHNFPCLIPPFQVAFYFFQPIKIFLAMIWLSHYMQPIQSQSNKELLPQYSQDTSNSAFKCTFWSSWSIYMRLYSRTVLIDNFKQSNLLILSRL